MKKITTILFIYLIGNCSLTYANHFNQNNWQQQYENTPIERIFIHQNTSLIFSGEQLYYKVYCLDSETNNLSKLSKIAYVELIDSNKTPIFKHKIKLISGLGQGEFIIPKTIASGSYKLIGYTQSMKNNTQNSFFQSDIILINPFNSEKSSNSKNIQDLKKSNLNLKNESLNTNSVKTNSLQNSIVDLTTKSINFKNRDKVVLSIKGANNNSFGNYSISVRKIDSIQIPETKTSFNSKPENIWSKLISTKNTSENLPELRGELISGSIFNKGTKSPASNINVAISIPGSHSIFKIATTDKLGNFYFNISDSYNSNYAVVQVINKTADKFAIKINEHSSLNIENTSFYNFQITPEIKDYILQRHIFNQIENVYANFRPNIIKKIDSQNPFLSSETLIYNLEDFKRFSTLKETVVEIIPEIFTSTKNKNSSFHVKFNNQVNELNLLPMIILDGILVQNHNELVSLNSKIIMRILINRNNYIFYNHIFEGVISIETINGDYQMNGAETSYKKINLFKPLPTKTYFNQVYNENKKDERIPDYRSQLLWEPNFVLNKKEQTITFFTSDNCGDYEICLEGFTKDGQPVSSRKLIKVEK